MPDDSITIEVGFPIRVSWYQDAPGQWRRTSADRGVSACLNGWVRSTRADVTLDANAASKRAAQVALSMQAGIVFEAKSDGSPVTAADKACESIFAAMFSEA